MLHIGIDYSINSSGITINDSLTDETHFYFLLPEKKFNKFTFPDCFHPTLKPDFEKTDTYYYEKVFEFNKKFTLDCIRDAQNRFHDTQSHCTIEAHAFSRGASGLVFNIGENTGVLKNKLFTEGIEFNTVAPTSLKKFAVGMGTATKKQMIEAFEKQTQYDIYTLFNHKRTIKTLHPPLSDIADSYFLALYDKSFSLVQ